MWRKATAVRSPNAIEDLDQFDRAMGCVVHHVSVYATGVDFMYNRYSCEEMGEIAAEFERARAVPAGDITPKQPRRNSDLKRKVTAKGKMKYDPADIGKVHLWIPFGDSRRWVTLRCANPDMHGMPLWLHSKCMELAKVEADAFCSMAEQREFRARLFDMIGNVTGTAAAKQRKLLGRALDNPVTAKSLRRHVEIRPETPMQEDDLPGVAEDIDYDEHPFAPSVGVASGSVVSGSLAGASRRDALTLRPRPRTNGQKDKTWAQIQRERRGIKARSHTSRGTSNGNPTGKPIKTKRKAGLNLKWKEQ